MNLVDDVKQAAAWLQELADYLEDDNRPKAAQYVRDLSSRLEGRA